MVSEVTPRWISLWYRVAAIYGLAVLLPQYALTPMPGGEVNFYGFVGTAIAFQLAFWVIGSDPVSYRALMPVSVIEKVLFGVPVTILFAAGKVSAMQLSFGVIDLIIGTGFFMAWRATPNANEPGVP